MPYFEYMWLASTYRPTELGHAEIEILYLFAISKSESVYGIFKVLKEFWHRKKSPAYKDVHKRVKRLLHLKLVDQIKEHFERGAKHYKITPYGLITCLDSYMLLSYHHGFILNHKENIVIRSLLLEFLEEETIDSFLSLREFPTMDIGEYLHDCCSITADICKEFWTKIERYNITDILPNDDIIQKYMSYLDGKPVDQHILDEISEYKKRLTAKLNNNNNKSDNKELASAVDEYEGKHFSHDAIRHYERTQSIMPYNRSYLEERPPFPLLDIYYDLVWSLSIRLEEKTKLLAFNLVSQLGEMIINSKIESQDKLEDFLEGGRDYSLSHILNDKQFIELVRAVKKEFDVGYKQFLYYH
jgi:hypothetical protein